MTLNITNRYIEHWINHSLENISEEIDGIVYKEKWKDIQSFIGIYKISTFGRIKSLERKVSRGKIGDKPIKEIIKSQSLHKNGYLSVMLSNGGKHKRILIHTLVANAFISNKKNKRTVNHVNGQKTDNRLINLERATDSENQLHSYSVLKRTPTWLGKENKKIQKRVFCPTNGATYNSLTEAARILDMCMSGISAVCSGHRNIHNGHKFKYLL